jgi:hypothetical protein
MQDTIFPPLKEFKTFLGIYQVQYLAYDKVKLRLATGRLVSQINSSMG